MLIVVYLCNVCEFYTNLKDSIQFRYDFNIFALLFEYENKKNKIKTNRKTFENE